MFHFDTVIYASKLLPIESYSTEKICSVRMCYYHPNLAQDLHLLQYCYTTIGTKYFAFEFSNNFTSFFLQNLYIFTILKLKKYFLESVKSDNIITKSLAPLLCIAEGRIVALYPLIAILPQMLLFFKVSIFYTRYTHAIL